MKRANWFVTAAISAGLLVSMLPAQAADRGWAFYQSSPHLGVFYVYMSPNGLAAVNKKMGATIVSKSPKWDVVMYNEKTKVYFMCSLEEWKGSFQGSPRSRKYKAVAQKAITTPPRKGKSAVIAGLRATQYITDSPIQGTSAKRAELWVSEDVPVPPQLTTLLAKTYGYGLGNLRGMPLRVAYIDETGKRIPVMDTLKAQQQMIPTQSFTHPPNFKRVMSEVAVFMDEKGRKAMEDIMDDLGGDEGDDLSALLGTSSGGSSSSRSSYSSGSYRSGSTGSYRPSSSYTSTATRPATTTPTTQQKPAQGQGDWWSNLNSLFGQKK